MHHITPGHFCGVLRGGHHAYSRLVARKWPARFIGIYGNGNPGIDASRPSEPYLSSLNTADRSVSKFRNIEIGSIGGKSAQRGATLQPQKPSLPSRIVCVLTLREWMRCLSTMNRPERRKVISMAAGSQKTLSDRLTAARERWDGEVAGKPYRSCLSSEPCWCLLVIPGRSYGRTQTF